MPASEAQIRANRANSLKSTGPKTVEGKERSRANALKHGLTGEGIVLAAEDAAEIERKVEAYEADLRPTDEIGRELVRRAAICAVRMERSALQEAASIRKNMLEAIEEAEANGEDPVLAGRLALFDPSKEACLARKYEAAAERGFFRALKEFQQLQRKSDAPMTAAKAEAQAARKSMDQLASFFPAINPPPAATRPAVPTPAPAPKTISKPLPTSSKTVLPAWNPAFGGSVDIPITIGRAR